MSGAKHTPGPWAWDRNKPGSIWQSQGVVRKDGFAFVMVALGGEDGKSNDGEAIDANARLIAAAPQMLEALEAMQNIINYDRTQEEVPTWDCTCEPNDTCPPCKVEKAIKAATARGESGGEKA